LLCKYILTAVMLPCRYFCNSLIIFNWSFIAIHTHTELQYITALVKNLWVLSNFDAVIMQVHTYGCNTLQLCCQEGVYNFIVLHLHCHTGITAVMLTAKLSWRCIVKSLFKINQINIVSWQHNLTKSIVFMQSINLKSFM